MLRLLNRLRRNVVVRIASMIMETSMIAPAA